MSFDRINRVLIPLARFVLGGVFLFYSIGKIADPAAFAREIGNYHILPLYAINLLAIVLPWVELVCGALLIAGTKLRASSVVVGAMLVVFIVAIFSAMSRGLNINCGCSTVNVEMVGWKKIGEDALWLMLAVYIFFFPNRSLSFVDRHVAPAE